MASMEKLLEDGINAIGLGPQGMDGKYSVMGVHIENTARHPSAIGVAVNAETLHTEDWWKPEENFRLM